MHIKTFESFEITWGYRATNVFKDNKVGVLVQKSKIQKHLTKGHKIL